MPDLSVWPTDGGDGSVSSEARWRKMARIWANTGIRQGGDLAPTLVAGPTINVAAGQCWVDGHFCELATAASVPASATGLLVVRFTPADNHAELLYRDGVSVPTQTDATFEMPVALMNGGSLFDRRVLAVGGETGVFASAVTTVITALNPTYGAVPGTTLPVWGPGEYLVSAMYDFEVTTLAAGNLVYGSIITSGPWSWVANGPNRCFTDMFALKRDTRHLIAHGRVTAPAAVSLSLGVCKGSATGVVQIIGPTGCTTLNVRRIG